MKNCDLCLLSFVISRKLFFLSKSKSNITLLPSMVATPQSQGLAGAICHVSDKILFFSFPGPFIKWEVKYTLNASIIRLIKNSKIAGSQCGRIVQI